MMKKQLAFQTVTALILMLCILSLAVTLTLHFRQLYYFDIDYLHISEQSGIPADEIRLNYDALIDYNSFFGPDTLQFPTLAMSETGRIHFEEVKVLFLAFEKMLAVTLVLSVLCAYLCARKAKSWLFLKLTSIFTVTIPAVLAVCIGLNWDMAFVTFHHIFFQNDYWIFYPDQDPVITMLPDTFFLHCAVMILALVVLGSVLCGVLYHRLKGGFRQKKKPA